MPVRADQPAMSITVTKKAADFLSAYATKRGLSRSRLVVQLVVERLRQLGLDLPDVEVPDAPAWNLNADERRLLRELRGFGIGVPVELPRELERKRRAAVQILRIRATAASFSWSEIIPTFSNLSHHGCMVALR